MCSTGTTVILEEYAVGLLKPFRKESLKKYTKTIRSQCSVKSFTVATPGLQFALYFWPIHFLHELGS